MLGKVSSKSRSFGTGRARLPAGRLQYVYLKNESIDRESLMTKERPPSEFIFERAFLLLFLPALREAGGKKSKANK